MPEPLTLAALFGAAFDWAVSKVGDAGVAALKAKLRERSARRELGEIAARAVETAAAAVPELADTLRSEAYVRNVLAPAVLDVLHGPANGLNPAKLAARFLDRFVAPYVGRSDIDDVLSRAFKLRRETVEAAFVSLVEGLRRDLLVSEYWREAIRDVGIEATRLGMVEANRKLDALLTPEHDLERSRADARAGSTLLRTWPSTIRGLYLDRPELAKLVERIDAHPGGSTLVIGPAGSGKSALLAGLTEHLERAGITVFAIKADKLPETVASLADISGYLGLSGDIAAEIDALARAEPVVLIIDQMDAVSEVMDRSSNRMNLLLQLATRWHDGGRRQAGPAVHVVVSSRPFEARHDGRFQSLRAEELELTLPSYERIEDLLRELAIDPAKVPAALRETVRRPFMLKLFTEIALRGVPTAGLVEGELLTAWLGSAQLGSPSERKEVLEVLRALAREMIETETLWRPADRYELEHMDALRRAEASELLVRRDGTLGFSHQAWLDDFQAKQFTSGEALAAFTFSSQDSLFGRATLLRALERMRALEPEAYARALDLLLGDVRTRRHIRHLVVDFLAGQGAPLAHEVRWVQRLVQDDEVLARLAITRLANQWAGWRDHLKPLIKRIAVNEGLRWHAAQLTISEAAVAPESAEELLMSLWGTPEQDLQAFEICYRAALWSPGVKARVAEILTRRGVSDSFVAHYAAELAEKGRAEAAVELLVLHLADKPAKERGRRHLHGLEKVVEGAPIPFARAMLPWFVQAATSGVASLPRVHAVYPLSQGLPFDWRDHDSDEGDLFRCLRHALFECARQAPTTFLELTEPLDGVEVDEVQALVAEGFAAGVEDLAAQAADWLLADPRRLHLGSVHTEDEHHIGHMVHDWSTRLLLKVLAAKVDRPRLERIYGLIESWDSYREEAKAEAEASVRRDWRRYAEEHRAPLLALLPAEIMSPRRRRQVGEAIAGQPKLSDATGVRMARFVPSPMSEVQMARASDDELFRMIDEVNDQGGLRFERRLRGLSGGVSQLSQAFAAFGKAEPERGLRLIRNCFEAGRHEQCAGALLRELAGQDNVDPEVLIELLRELHGRGFSSEDWRRDAAWAMQALAQRRRGLEDEDIACLESWIVRDPEVIAHRITSRENLEIINRERNPEKPDRPLQALLFGRGLDGLNILPSGNFPFVDAIAAGLLFREPTDREAWLEFLERYVIQPEDPVIWAAVLSRHAWGLWYVDPKRVTALFRTIWDRFPDAFGLDGSHFLWRHRLIVPADVRSAAVLSWLTNGEAQGQQLAGEYAMAARLVDPEDVSMGVLADRLLAGELDAARLGAIFAAAAAWREDDPNLRALSHAILAPLAREATGAEADAISTALDQTRTLIPDEMTRELLAIARQNPALLRACLNSWFADGLQELLHHPTFDQTVLELSEQAVDLLVDDRPDRMGLLDKDFVSIAIALQRSDGEQRARAMNVYERLLDAGNHYADRAARDSLRRS